MESESCTCPWSNANRYFDNDHVQIDQSCPVHGHLREARRQAAYYSPEIRETRGPRPPVGNYYNPEIRETRDRTDGRIVGACPGCGDRLRMHETMHGKELRHLENNHVRCNASRHEALLPLLGEEAAGAESSVGGSDLLSHITPGGGSQPKQQEPVDEWAYRANGFEASLKQADYLGRPDANNLGGRGDDPFRAKTWDNPARQRPTQRLEDMNPNTPTMAQEPLRTRNINTPNPGQQLRDDRFEDEREDDEDDD